ncbi:MAG: chemotaxis protein CheA [Methyloprofundus sp.]|nr:chemotaxis protein CheA [Methyloprofundus sp.]
MSIDMAQFHQVFFEESFEGLDIMESGLLNLDMGDVDSETINTIFRAAHSIKGGSGTFGFSSVANFTHVMETLLDEMRDGRRQVTQSVVDVLLGSVDCLREMMTAIQDESEVDDARVAEHKQELEVELNGGAVADSAASVAEPEMASPALDANELAAAGWKISFCPHTDLLKTGNDPVRMFRELAELGDLEVIVDFQGVPTLFELDPEECHLSWTLIVKGDIAREGIDDIFDWVEDECDLSVQPLSASQNRTAGTLAVAETVLATPEPSSVSANTSSVDETPAPAEVSPKAPVKSKSPAAKSKTSSSIRVDTGKIDTLINMVGELVITQSMLSLVGENFSADKLDQLKNGLTQLERHTRELQESVMNIRMLPISFVFSRFPRLVHDLSSKLDKKIELKLVGEHTEVDKTVVELISDPLVHLVRNSLDHGIEMPADRLAAGKLETGTVTLEAYHRGGNIVIEVKDDGKGLNKDVLRQKAIEKGLVGESAVLTDKQCYDLIFMAGFSTAAEVTDVSGRGVGMDVVRRNIQSLGGNIEIISELGVGTTMSIHLPLTLAILDGQSIAVGDETYIVPLGSIIESINLTDDMVNRVAGKGETFRLRDEYLPIVRMHDIFHVESAKAINLMDGLMVVVEGQGVRCGLFVDDLLGQQQVVIKSLEANYRCVEGVSSATILGDGSVGLILDIPGLVRLSNQ